MSNQYLPEHSGSRWEPPAGHDPIAESTPTEAQTGAATAPEPAGDRRGRRRRGPLLAVLATVLTLGASTAGIAYVQAAQSPDSSEPPAATGPSPSASAPGAERTGDDHDREHDGAGDGRWGEHRHDGGHDDDGPGDRAGDGAHERTGDDTDDGEQPS